MSQSSDMQEIHLLNLTDEIFLNIFSYVNISSRKKVSRVCRRFYELMCIVERDCHPLELSYSQICDEEIRSSIVKSSREFEDLIIYPGDYPDELNRKHKIEMKYIQDVVSKFGRRIKKFNLRQFQLSESELRRIFYCIPNVETLTLEFLEVNIEPDENISELNLCKLKKLTIIHSSNCLNILNRLPKDTIKEASFFSYEDICCQQFFNQQANIKILDLSENNQVKYDHLKLEHLKLNSEFINLLLILRQQPRLRYIDCADNLIDVEIFKAICELRNLEVAKMCVDLGLPCRVFESLKNLAHLKELQLKSEKIHECNHLHELSRMHLKIEKLTLLYSKEKIPPEFFIQLSQNFRKLNQITIVNRSFNTINTILEYLPNLESIVFNCESLSPEEDILVVNENLRHEKLKDFVVTSLVSNIYKESNTRSLVTLLNACPNLERISLSKLHDAHDQILQQIIGNHSKLTHLSLDCNFCEIYDENDAKLHIISSAANRLKYIRLRRLNGCYDYEYEGWSDSEYESSLEDLFEDEFNYIRYNDDDDYDHSEIIMKKRNASDWYQDLKERIENL
ncbi:CLUMA_CG021316, isoform A [Clunio marinus]|uniref:CLUMA_CG021316, isoform A n=1 Tax=Clunio marinus TaxID=568069 RepID=A0A1J1JC08_9DIPT|nr:CLUMA_CG021316, isoform A [Clunio marinus]